MKGREDRGIEEYKEKVDLTKDSKKKGCCWKIDAIFLYDESSGVVVRFQVNIPMSIDIFSLVILCSVVIYVSVDIEL